MILLTPELRAALRANAAATRAAQDQDRREPDHRPLVKLFNPCGAATWLAAELAPDGDILFGLADLGFGCPELGYFSLTEIAALRLPFGLHIERDEGFATAHPLSIWAETSRRKGSIILAEQALPKLPLGNPADPNDPLPS
jgi:hypothetical protein